LEFPCFAAASAQWNEDEFVGLRSITSCCLDIGPSDVSDRIKNSTVPSCSTNSESIVQGHSGDADDFTLVYRVVEPTRKDNPPCSITHAQSEPTTEDKLVLVFALQNGRWQDLLALHEWAFHCYARGLLPSRLVDALIFPSSDWNTRLQLRYKEPRVRNLLVRVQKSRLPEEEEWLEQYIVDVLSGKAAGGLNAARRDGQLRDWNRKD
jgi:hypothetical protein